MNLRNKILLDQVIQLIRKQDKVLSSSVVYINHTELRKVTKLLAWMLNLSPHLPLLYKFSSHIHSLWMKSGPKFIVLYLKETHLAIMKFIAGDTYEIQTRGTRVMIDKKTKLPAIIPQDLRHLMMINQDIVRAVLTISSLYRVIECKGSVDTTPITDEFNGIEPSLPKGELEAALKELPKLYLRGKPRFLTLFSSGPNHPMSVLGYIWDAYSLSTMKRKGETSVWMDFATLSSVYNSNTLLWAYSFYSIISRPIVLFLRLIGWRKLLTPGRLSIKIEPAGKRRIFAITDAWTQSFLNPLHKGIFGILQRLPMDGTFNQNGPLRKLVDRFRGGNMYSYDLSSATDRLPIILQKDIISLLVNNEQFAVAWCQILSDRDWFLKGKPYRYSVGQPMGALSSWGMLALTHHVIVRVAAHRVGLSNFSDYAILGDDIVIAHSAVATSYLSIMRTLGVGISLHKTLLSTNGTCEFAKRLVSNRGEYTPIGASLLVLASRNWSFVPNLFIELATKGKFLSADKICKRFKDEVFPLFTVKQHVRILISLVGPGGYFVTSWSSIVKMEDWTVNNVITRLPVSSWMLAVEMFESNKLQSYLIQGAIVKKGFSFSEFPILTDGFGYKNWWGLQILSDIIYYFCWIPGTCITLISMSLYGDHKLIYKKMVSHFDHWLSLLSPGPYLLYYRLIEGLESAIHDNDPDYDLDISEDDVTVVTKSHHWSQSPIQSTVKGSSLLDITDMILDGFSPLVSLDLNRSNVSKFRNYFEGGVLDYIKHIEAWKDSSQPLSSSLSIVPYGTFLKE